MADSGRKAVYVGHQWLVDDRLQRDDLEALGLDSGGDLGQRAAFGQGRGAADEQPPAGVDGTVAALRGK